jgi:hypothetical protein
MEPERWFQTTNRVATNPIQSLWLASQSVAVGQLNHLLLVLVILSFYQCEGQMMAGKISAASGPLSSVRSSLVYTSKSTTRPMLIMSSTSWPIVVLTESAGSVSWGVQLDGAHIWVTVGGVEKY